MPNPARETPSDPRGIPVAPLYGTREAARTVPNPQAAPVARPDTAPNPAGPAQSGTETRPAAPEVTTDAPSRPPIGQGQGQRKRIRDVPVAAPPGNGSDEKREPTVPEPRRPPAAKGRAPAEGASPVVMMQKVVRPEHVQHYLEGGYDLVAGYVHRFQDVREMTTPAALIRGLGLVYEGSPFTPMDEQIHAIRWPAVKPPLFRRPLGGIDEWSMGIIPGGWVIEKAPFPGSGYAPGDGPAVPEFKIESQRLPHGAEMYRLAADGRETLVAVYDADLRGWLVKLPGGAGERA